LEEVNMGIFKRNHCWYCGHTRNLCKSTALPGHWVCKDADGMCNQRFRERGSVAYEPLPLLPGYGEPVRERGFGEG